MSAPRIYATALTVPAGTPIATPVSQAVALEDNQLDWVEIVIPDGHAGLTGFAIHWSSAQILPYTPGTWLIGNNDRITYDYGSEVTQSGLAMVAYNLGLYVHSFYVRWQISDLAPSTPVPIVAPQSGFVTPVTDLATIMSLTSGP